MKRIFISSLICLLLTSACVYALSYSDGTTGPTCPIHDTPLKRCGSYSWYIAEDKALNSRYKSLSKLLTKKELIQLKLAQRDWLKWRDKTCEEMQAKSGCENGLCEGVAHDECVIHLTESRALELRAFLKNPGDGIKKQFQFSRQNKYLDSD